ncbi:MAG: hypothetical protein JXR76_12925 [Deltaproteobacteria bacterium]|nr:hypothetical protein [Deltaproteobacteria bacterium]
MIYCPSCKKPSARNTGKCPHCGFNFDSTPKTTSPRTDASDTASALSDLGAGETMPDGDDAEDLPLELAIDESMPRTSTHRDAVALSNNDGGAISISEADDLPQIAEIAKFGPCENGIVGTMRYGLRVYQRLPQLLAETDTVRRQKDSAWAALVVAKARLGQWAYRQGVQHKLLNSPMAKAAKADSRLEEVQRQEAALTHKYAQQFSDNAQTLRAVQTEMTPTVEEEQITRNRFEALTKDRARLNAKIKRTEIELRNLRELIEKKQMAYADLKRPKEERATLLKEIAEVDNKQPPLLNRLTREQKELEDTDTPYKGVADQLQQVEAALNAYNQKIGQIKDARAALESEQQAELETIHSKAQGESKHAKEAWAAVGELVYIHRLAPQKALDSVAKVARTFFEAQEQLRHYEKACQSYNRSAYAQAKKYWLAAGILAGVLLIILVAAAVF